MPVYFFHIVEGDSVTTDHEGIERPDIAAAQEVAIQAVSSLIAEAVANGDRSYHGRIIVEDEVGGPVLTVTFGSRVQLEMTS